MSQTCLSLVIGMSNYGSNVAEKCISQFTTNLPSTADDESTEDVHDPTAQVFALTLGDEISIMNES